MKPVEPKSGILRFQTNVTLVHCVSPKKIFADIITIITPCRQCVSIEDITTQTPTHARTGTFPFNCFMDTVITNFAVVCVNRNVLPRKQTQQKLR